MKNYVGENTNPTLVLLADCESGEFVTNGYKHGFAITAGVTGQTIAIKASGLFTAPKATEAQDVGELLYYHATNKQFQKTATADTLIRAYVNTAALSGDANVELALVQARAGVETGDISNVTAGIGLTGGGSSGAVTLSADFGTASGKVCQGNDTRLSDDRTPTAHAASHAEAGSDAITPSAIGACADDDARLTDDRDPTAHAASHATAGGDAIAASDIGAMPVIAAPTAGRLLVSDENGNAVESAAALTDFPSPATILTTTNVDKKQITVALGAATGVAADDPDWVGATVIGPGTPISGVDQLVASVAVSGTGGLSITLEGNSTAEAVYEFVALLV